MKRLRLFFLIFTWGCSLKYSTGETRTVNICVLNDVRAPIKDTSFVRKSIEAASSSYEENAEIVFRINEYHDYSGPIWKMTGMHSVLLDDTAINGVCDSSEIKTLFTNQSKKESLGFVYKGALAEASGKLPVVIIFEAENPPIYLNSGEHPLSWLLIHEIGHLFMGPRAHSQDTLSFMYEYINKSYGQWTKHDKKNIILNKAKKFVASPN